MDSEVLLALLKSCNFDVEHEIKGNNGDIIIVNTCGFINDAKQESIDTILDFAEAKKKSRIKELYVMGCLSQRYKETLVHEIPEVDRFFGVNDFKSILNYFNLKAKKDFHPAERILSTPHHYAYLKVSEGCNRKCSFCTIPSIRGRHVSIPAEHIIHEAEFLSQQGVKEIILVAQDLTYYGLDIYRKKNWRNC